MTNSRFSSTRVKAATAIVLAVSAIAVPAISAGATVTSSGTCPASKALRYGYAKSNFIQNGYVQVDSSLVYAGYGGSLYRIKNATVNSVTVKAQGNSSERTGCTD